MPTATSRRYGQRLYACRRTPVSGRLLVRVTDLDQCWLAPGSAEHLKAGRQGPTHESHRDVDRRKPGRRRNPWAVVAVRRVEITDQTRRVVPRRIDERVEPGVVHGLENALREAPPVFVRLLAFGVLIRRRLRQRVEHPLLDRGMEFLRGEDVIEGLHRRLRTKPREIPIDVVLEAVAEKFRRGDFSDFRN